LCEKILLPDRPLLFLTATVRRISRSVAIGGLTVGGGNPILLQSMLSRPLADRDGCRRQVEELEAEGCSLIRVAIPTARDLLLFQKLREAATGKNLAFVGDLHYGSELALEALDLLEKVRINPGNFAIRRTVPADAYTDDLFRREQDAVAAAAEKFFLKARRLARAVRIGSNGGSLAARSVWKRGQGPDALIESALEMARWARRADFHRLVFSFKTSSADGTIAVNRLARARMDELGWDYPFHLGVTEAGSGIWARAAGALGIGQLLGEGLGDTARISLTESPSEEICFGKKLLAFCEKHPFPAPTERFGPVEIVEDGSRTDVLELPPAEEPFDGDRYLLATLHAFLSAKRLKFIRLSAGPHREERKIITRAALQACRLGEFFTAIVACPTCGRTTYDVAGTVEDIRRRLGNRPDLRIAVMGCCVNGLGEMCDADYGCVGCGNGKVDLYVRGDCVLRAVAAERAAEELEKLTANDREKGA
jgi:(E)-4-hydroxy-3-methylbut-2-enyl-diphosphate synthase